MEDIKDFLNESLIVSKINNLFEYLKEDKYCDEILNFYEENKDNKIASYYLFNMYVHIPKIYDTKKAIEHLENSAKQNFAPSLYNLGHAYHGGIIIERDYVKALNYLKLCLEQNYDDFLNNRVLHDIGIMYKCGQGTEKNYEIANKYFELSL